MPKIQFIVFEEKSYLAGIIFNTRLHPFRTYTRDGSAIIIGKTDTYNQYQNIRLWQYAAILCLTSTLTCATPLRYILVILQVACALAFYSAHP